MIALPQRMSGALVTLDGSVATTRTLTSRCLRVGPCSFRRLSRLEYKNLVLHHPSSYIAILYGDEAHRMVSIILAP